MSVRKPFGRMLLVALVALGCAPLTLAADAVDLRIVNRIIDEGMNRSELPGTAAYLCDRIGARLTNSPQMRQAEQWTQERFRAWGLRNVRTEGFEFGRGWSIEEFSVYLVSPRRQELRGIPIAWTPGTQSAVRAAIVVAPMEKERDFENWRGKLRGRIVLVSRPDAGSEPTQIPFVRLTDEELARADELLQPVESAAELAKKLTAAAFEAARDEFLAAEGALVWVRSSIRDGGLVHGEGYLHKSGATAKLPAVELAAEDYRKLARLAKTDAEPQLEVVSRVRFHDEDRNAYNILADILGTDLKAGYVMAGAHLDSWVAADGAQDNAAGSVTVMEAARILAKLAVKPKRSIRFALWAGEEQGLLGSLAYVQRHLATRAPATQAPLVGRDDFRTFKHRWPVQPVPGNDALSVYFNLDNGSGKIRGVFAEGNIAAMPVLREWLAPFSSLGASRVAARSSGGTDHVFMQSVGIPGFQFIQDPLDYVSRTHHSSVDTYDHLKIADLKQAAVVLASMLLSAANSAEPLPRMPLPQRPNETDPFAYDDEGEGS